MCMLRIPAAFCLGDRDFCCCEKCVVKCPKYNFVGTTMSRPLCEKPGCPQPGKKRKATVAHTGKENEQEGGSEAPCSPATKVSVSQAEGGRYAKHAHESWPPSMYDATRKVAQNHFLAHFLSRYEPRLPSASSPVVGILAFHTTDDSW